MVLKMVLSMPSILSVRQILIPESIRMSMLSMPSDANARVDSNKIVMSMPLVRQISMLEDGSQKGTVDGTVDGTINARGDSNKMVLSLPSVGLMLMPESIRSKGTVDATGGYRQNFRARSVTVWKETGATDEKIILGSVGYRLEGNGCRG